MKSKEIYESIVEAAALALFATAYADQAESAGQPFSGEIMDQLPEDIDHEAQMAAYRLMHCWTELYSFKEPALSCAQKVTILYGVAVRAYNLQLPGEADRELDPDNFGHYLAMQAMGTGVGLESFGYMVSAEIAVPHFEFSRYDLSKKYFKGGQ